jgi:hypothetical protein
MTVITQKDVDIIMGRMRMSVPKEEQVYTKLKKLSDRRVGEVWIVYNVWDCADFWMQSLVSAFPHADGIVVLSGPYTERAKQGKKIDDDMRRVFDSIHKLYPHVKVEWTYKDMWSSHMEKRSYFFESGDKYMDENSWALILDDDEMLYPDAPLKDLIACSPYNVIMAHWREEEVFLFQNQYAGIMEQQMLKEPQDVFFKTRLFRWRDGIHYHMNHWTLAYWDENGEEHQIVGKVKLWNLRILHVRGLRSIDEKVWQHHYYNDRSKKQEDKERLHSDWQAF